jgi:hypothetical protein
MNIFEIRLSIALLPYVFIDTRFSLKEFDSLGEESSPHKESNFLGGHLLLF